MRYFQMAQPVPGKGDALMFYECEDDGTIVRYVTYIPGTGEVEHVTDPIVKKLYRPEFLRESTRQEFEEHWNITENA